jgi:two-component sensor histidine kinase
VKNNLQIISSLLYLQSEYIDDQQSLKVFQESQNRVKSMAMVHDNVYQSRELSRVDFPAYIEKLANYLYRSYNINKEVITLSIDVDNVYMTPDTAIPCGLIINELMLNSLKHAFPVETAGAIHIEFHALPDGRLVLTFGDNGVDFSRELDPTNSSSLGLKLVNMLTRQLQGTMEFDGSQGNVFRIIFPPDNTPRQGS